MTDLFRPEALESRHRDWLGSVQLIRPVSLRVLTAFVVLTFVAVAAFLTFGSYARKARVGGYLVPSLGVIRLVPPQPATVLESHVAEGKPVRRGDVLYVLSVEQNTPTGDTQEAVQNSLRSRERSLQALTLQRSELDAGRTAALARQIAGMRQELAQMDAEADLQAQRLELARQAQARLESLRADNFVSSAQVQAKGEEVLGLRAQLQGLRRQQAAHQREIDVLAAQRRELPLAQQERQGEIARDLAGLAQQLAENEARRRVVVRAPQDGVITGVIAEPGQSVTPAAALASLLPAQARLQAQLFAPSSAVGFLRPEQEVLLRYQAFPYQKFGHQRGRVLQVSRSPLEAAELAGLPLAGNTSMTPSSEPLYRITVALERQDVTAYGQAQPLASGMQLDADVLLDRRRLIEWIFEPVLGIAGRV